MPVWAGISRSVLCFSDFVFRMHSWKQKSQMHLLDIFYTPSGALPSSSRVVSVTPATLIYCTDRHHVGLLLQFHTLPTLFYIRVIDSLRFIYIHKYFWVREYIATRGNQKEQERRVLLVLASHGVVVFWKHGILIPPPAVATGTAVCWSS
jgi:hypothetical protein